MHYSKAITVFRAGDYLGCYWPYGGPHGEHWLNCSKYGNYGIETFSSVDQVIDYLMTTD